MTSTQKTVIIALVSFILGGCITHLSILHWLSKGTFSPSSPISTSTTSSSTATGTESIHISSPSAGSTIVSPLTITGQAKGTWFFEASFPITLVDDTGTAIAQTHAEATADWMTQNFVPFTATLNFSGTKRGQHATLILKKDNPSGLPENAGELRIPVTL
jgi:hypothetical protein